MQTAATDVIPIVIFFLVLMKFVCLVMANCTIIAKVRIYPKFSIGVYCITAKVI
ncbi:MAG: hypothetical protein JWQ40_273 [Segetibacter sp.]|nr:hypothetical protein [Segetibacter sp.]